MAQRLATPGVYIEEKNAFPNSVVGLPTAVPAFIGYTEKASKGGKSVINRPVRLTSLAQYVAVFGGVCNAKFSLSPTDSNDYDLETGGKKYVLEKETNSRFMLYNAMRFFFENGGSTCYVVSVGTYGDLAAGDTLDISKTALQKGVETLIAEEEPTLLVVPEAVLLEEGDCFALQQAMLAHCGGKMRNRFAVLDVYNGYRERSYDEEDVITRFRNGVGANFLNYGAAYYPWMHSTVVQMDELNYTNVSNLDVLTEILNAEAEALFGSGKKADELKAEIAKMTDADADVDAVQKLLVAVSPTLKKILTQVRGQLNILPPSSAMVGVYTMVDNSRGVWKAPANVSVSSTVAPTVNITSDDQEDLNVTLSGKSINAIRPFIGEGILVWGARTLDGNSQDWRYVNVRRTLIFIEQSIKYAAKAYVFEPNTAPTWSLIRSMLDSFLTNLWKSGALVGGSPAAAYEISLGLGDTMTPEDILDGIMRISVKVAISRPAEFIVITFQQKMQES